MTHPPGILEGVTAPLRGASHILTHRDLWPYAIRAFVANIVVLLGVVVLFALFVPGIVGWLMPDAPRLFKGIISCAIWIGAAVLALMFFTALGNVIAGPFLEAMTERMMADAGRRPPAARAFPIALKVSIVNQAARLLLFGGSQLVLMALLFTPAGVVYPLIAVGCTVFFLAFEYLDYPLEARRLGFKAKLKWLAGHPVPVLGFGAVLLVVVPFTAYAYLPAVVCGAVLLEDDVEKAI
jgi:CysZ protein